MTMPQQQKQNIDMQKNTGKNANKRHREPTESLKITETTITEVSAATVPTKGWKTSFCRGNQVRQLYGGSLSQSLSVCVCVYYIRCTCLHITRNSWANFIVDFPFSFCWFTATCIHNVVFVPALSLSLTRSPRLLLWIWVGLCLCVALRSMFDRHYCFLSLFPFLRSFPFRVCVVRLFLFLSLSFWVIVMVSSLMIIGSCIVPVPVCLTLCMPWLTY